MTVKEVMVIGAGQMGAGIALVFARSGYQVKMYDTNIEALKRGKQYIEKIFDKDIAKGKMEADTKKEALNRLQLVVDLDADPITADFIIEAVVEKVEVKKKYSNGLMSLHRSIPFLRPIHPPCRLLKLLLSPIELSNLSACIL